MFIYVKDAEDYEIAIPVNKILQVDNGLVDGVWDTVITYEGGIVKEMNLKKSLTKAIKKHEKDNASTLPKDLLED